jgi:hypothetical protein
MDLKTITTLLGFAKAAVDIAGAFSSKIAPIPGAKRERLAKYCESIAAAISSAHTALRAGEIPHEACARMQIYSEELPHVAAGLIPKAKVDILVELLENRQSPNAFLRTYCAPRKGKILDAELYAAVGMLQGAANTLRAI